MQLLKRSFDVFRKAGIDATNLVEKQLEQTVTRLSEIARPATNHRDQLERISHGLIQDGFVYGEKASFFDEIDIKKTDCQGNTFLHALISDNLSSTKVDNDEYRLVSFQNPQSLASHVAIGVNGMNSVWETTKPGMIDPNEIIGWGFNKSQIHPWGESKSLAESIAVAHLNSRQDYQAIFSFIDNISFLPAKYPSVNFYLRHKYRAVEQLWRQGLINTEDYLRHSNDIVTRLTQIDPRDLNLVIQKARLYFERATIPNINKAIELLEAVDQESLSEASHEIQHKLLFITGYGYFLKYIEKQQRKDKLRSLMFFRKSTRYNDDPNLVRLALKNIAKLKQSGPE